MSPTVTKKQISDLQSGQMAATIFVSFFATLFGVWCLASRLSLCRCQEFIWKINKNICVRVAFVAPAQKNIMRVSARMAQSERFSRLNTLISKIYALRSFTHTLSQWYLLAWLMITLQLCNICTHDTYD